MLCQCYPSLYMKYYNNRSHDPEWLTNSCKNQISISQLIIFTIISSRLTFSQSVLSRQEHLASHVCCLKLIRECRQAAAYREVSEARSAMLRVYLSQLRRP